MLHAKFQDHRKILKIFKVLAIYGHSGHLGHVTKTIFTKFIFPLPNEAPHKIWL